MTVVLFQGLARDEITLQSCESRRMRGMTDVNSRLRVSAEYNPSILVTFQHDL